MSSKLLTYGLAFVFLALITGVAAVLLFQGDGPPSYSAALGKEGQTNGDMVTPAGVAVDSSGNLYVMDTGNNRIERFDATGKFIDKFGQSGSDVSQFDGSLRIKFDHQDNLWVSDTRNHRLEVFDSKMDFLAEVGSLGQEPGQFSHPGGVAFDAAGNIWVADTGNNRIQKFGPGGKNVLAIIPEDGLTNDSPQHFNGPWGICCDPLGTVYVADTGNNRIQRFTREGHFISSFGALGTEKGQFNMPTDVLIDREQNLYVVDSGNNRIQKFSQQGTPITQWGTEGEAAAQFHNPQQIAEAPDGTLYIADSGNSRVQVFKPRKAALFEKSEPLSQPGRPRAPSGLSGSPQSSPGVLGASPSPHGSATPTPEASATPAPKTNSRSHPLKTPAAVPTRF